MESRGKSENVLSSIEYIIRNNPFAFTPRCSSVAIVGFILLVRVFQVLLHRANISINYVLSYHIKHSS